jgi:hypothetical protein
VPRSEYSSETSVLLVSALKEKGAHDLKINVEVVSQIALPTSGKHRFIISKLEKVEDKI